MLLVRSKPIRSNVTIPTTSFSGVFFTNDVMWRVQWRHLSSLPHQFSILKTWRVESHGKDQFFTGSPCHSYCICKLLAVRVRQRRYPSSSYTFFWKVFTHNVYALSRDRLHIRYHWLCKFLETKRKILHEKGVQSIQELFGTPTWPPNLVPRVFSLSNMAPPPYWKARRPSGRGCMAAVWLFCTPIWLPWLRLKTIKVLGYHVGRTFIWLFKQCGILVNICQRRSSWQDVGSPY